MVGFPFDPSLHHIPGHSALKDWLHRHFKDKYSNTESLFVYLHMRTGKWVIAEWIGRPYNWMEDLVIVGDHPQEFTRSKRAKLEFLLVGPAMDPVWELESAENDRVREQQDFEDEDRDVGNFVDERLGGRVRIQ